MNKNSNETFCEPEEDKSIWWTSFDSPEFEEIETRKIQKSNDEFFEIEESVWWYQ